jgi:hypothetical protein
MATKDTLFTVAGITFHQGQTDSGTKVDRTKVRYSKDMVACIKKLTKPRALEDKTLGICLEAVRVDMVDLPYPMLKNDALKFLSTHPQFQSAADQATIQEEIDARTPKAPRVKKEKTVKVKVAKTKAAPTLDSIKSRVKKSVTPEQVLAAATSAVTE